MIVVSCIRAPLTAAIAVGCCGAQACKLFAMVNLIAGRRVVPELVKEVSLRRAWPAK